jgi:hypothetical protein
MYKFSYGLANSLSVRFFILFLGLYYFLSHVKGDLFLGADLPIKILFVLYALFISFGQAKVYKKITV